MPALDDTRAECYARLVAQGLTKRDAAIKAGYSEKTASQQGCQLYNRPAIRSRIEELRTKVENKIVDRTAKLIELEITSRKMRLAALNQRYQLMEQIRQERADDPTMAAVPGGKTGLIVRQLRAVGTGNNMRIVPEYALDAAMLKEIRAHEQQAATELGEWKGDREPETPAVSRIEYKWVGTSSSPSKDNDALVVTEETNSKHVPVQ